ncbi:MAG: hypothetical protein PHC70_03060 [Patescibacteria group bacterium]|nr:hypothetical protein [Patescibacteria group bacterium]
MKFKESLKIIVAGLALLSFGAALLSPVAPAWAQAYAVQDPGTSPPYDANPQNCIIQLTTEYGAPQGTAPGPLMTKDYANIQAQYYACWNAAAAKQQDWWYRRAQYLKNQWSMRFITSIYGGLIDAMAMISQRVAYEAANDLLTGNPGNEPRFWNSDFSTWLENAGMDASSKFLDRLDVVVGDWTSSQTATVDPKTGRVIPGPRFSFCKPPDPYSLKFSLGVGEVGRIGPGACNLKKVAENFQAIGDMVSSGEALQLHRPSVQYGASDLSVGVETNSQYFNYLINQRAGLSLNRQEDRGLRPVMDIVSGRIQVPTVLAEQSYRDLNPTSMAISSEAEQRSAILGAYFQVGLENIPMLALQTFSNTLIVGMLHKWLDPKAGGGLDNSASPHQIILTAETLKNADATGEAQDLYERQEFAKSLGDYLIPNFASTEDQDIVSELVTCNIPRKRFNCAMDQALGVAINVGTRDGALTVGRASGVGSQGATFSVASQALHSAWELIPESDIKNNTDPTCAQRAYCAGNLKKMRLARIIPIGWEMAANSPYNIKHSGKYITLGEVIGGFYDCNDQGKIDKEHPWCHLIDPNWILTAPKYQCRAKGYGDAILPEVGTRLEECGDMVSCLKSNQNGECVGGFGYCLAERPVWKFDAKECDEQFVSCRTYQYSGGQVSLLRNTEDKGKCSSENIGCQWYATSRYATSTASPDGLWVGTATSGPRVYLDKGVQPCSSEGCTKMFRITPSTSTTTAQSVLNLVQNGSFEQADTSNQNGNIVVTGFPGWTLLHSNEACLPFKDLSSSLAGSSVDGSRALKAFWPTGCAGPQLVYQYIPIVGGRNYVLSFNIRSDQPTNNGSRVQFQSLAQDGTYKPISDQVSTYGDCAWVGNGGYISFNKQAGNGWSKMVCQFASPPGASRLVLGLLVAPQSQDALEFDAIQLEEGEVVTPFVDGVAQGLAETYLKIAPDEYRCTGDDKTDNPACKRFARVCRQIDVGCQGYQDANDVTAPEVPAILSSKDLCPAMCAGYGEYRKLASTFDLVRDSAHPVFDDPEDETSAYFIPNLSEQCALEDVGCEPFTSMESATSTGEKVAYFKDVRLCEKPGDRSATYYTWEGSETTGYQLKTWSLIANTLDPSQTNSSAPKLVLRGGMLGYIKDPASCNADSWKLGSDPDCRQFYGVGGQVYYVFYSQTVSSDAACTNYRKDDSTEADCTKTGGSFVDASKSCTYQALPSESLTCSEVAGGCRAYMGPTGRNAVNVFRDTFATGTQISFDKQQGSNTTLQYSNESILVGDKSLKLEAPAGQSIDATLKLAINTTSSLMRISFWAKANAPKSSADQPAKIMVDGVEIGTFFPDINWSRFEVGPFMAKNNPTLIEIVAPAKAGQASNVIYIDTFSVDQLNDIRFVRKNHWAVPVACDSTPEGVPEPRYMVGCREYNDRNSNSVFVRNFGSLCRDEAIGCSAFIDTNDKGQPYPETKTVKGTPLPMDFNLNTYAKHGAAKIYEEQFFGDWSATSRGYRYYYAIDDARGRCDSSQASCRAYGKPIFQQDRLQLATTTHIVSPSETALYKSQNKVYGFETTLLKDDWGKYLKDNGENDLACSKDELFCDQFQSGNVTEYFRDPGVQTCKWSKAKKLKKNDAYGIPSDGEYSGWFRENTDIPCYGSYLAAGNNYLIQYSGEKDYAGWGGKCPTEQSECTELVDPNDTSDTTHPAGRSYYVINGPKLDKSSCGGTADPLSGCILFQDKGIGTLEASSQATYSKIMKEKGASQVPLNCETDPENEYCKSARKCTALSPRYNDNFTVDPGDTVGAEQNQSGFYKDWVKSLKESKLEGKVCVQDSDCQSEVKIVSRLGKQLTLGYIEGKCPPSSNDANVVLKVKMDRECARWMGCRTGETVFDSGQNKFVTQCTEMNICEQNGSRNEDIFCSKFTDRYYEDLLSYGQYIDAQSYSGRDVGFGKMDYSGLISPDHYLAADIKPRAVGYDLLKGSKSGDRYIYDQRAVAEVSENDLNIETGIKDPNFNVSGLELCKDKRTGRVGYLADQLCILPISEPTSLMLVAGQETQDTSSDVAQIYKAFEINNAGGGNNLLQSAMPSPECQVYPEENSPLPNQYVAEWNINANPPSPKRMAEGYDNASACVYGEDCSCSYRKVRYSGGQKYYALDGAAPAVGVCMGGDLDGQACVPGGYVAVGEKNKVIANSNITDTCKGGVCQTIQDVVSVFGKYGYCLERDLTRISSAAQIMAPCLTWSPMSVLGGKFDVTHRSPTAGYQPPQGMGEYYCSSGANVQKLITPSVTTAYVGGYIKHWANENFIAPGYLQQFAFSRPDVWYNKQSNNYSNKFIDGSDNKYSSTKLDETAATHTRMVGDETKNLRFTCRRASVCEGFKYLNDDISEDCNGDAANRTAAFGKCEGASDKLGLWITTGGGLSRSYLEYFIPYRPSFESLQYDALRPDAKYFDYRFGLFRLSLHPNAIGSACLWNPKWFGLDYPVVSQDKKTDFSCSEFLSQVQNLSSQIYQTANQNFPLILDRGSEKLLADTQGVPYRLGCLGNNVGSACYFKYWQIGFNDQDQKEFNWIDAGGYKDTPESFRWEKVYQLWYGQQCSASHPYFAIRAVFQNVNPAENVLEPDEARQTKLSGPWQFIGFWVTTCMPNQVLNDPGNMYLQMDMVKADVCKEVSQVVAPYTRENAAFADRVWAQGRFMLPVLGIQYNSPNEPFGSALATRQIGNDPMLMGASTPLSGDYLKSPTFVDSGLTMQSIFNDRQNSWMPLSNLFARIYKVYRWSPYTVNAGDWACIKGDKMANKCTPGSNTFQGLLDCGDYATCSDELDTDLINQDWRCNALSGVNRGLSCGTTNNWQIPTRNSDPICHNAAVYARLDPASNTRVEKCSEQDTSSCILANPGCKPADNAHPSLLSYTINTKGYDPNNKDFIVYFKPHVCQNNSFYAEPTLEKNNGLYVVNANWSDVSMLMYGVLQLSLKYDCTYDENGVASCTSLADNICNLGQSDKSSIVGILAALEGELTGDGSQHEMRDAFKAVFSGLHPKYNGIDAQYPKNLSPISTILNYWSASGFKDKKFPVRIALGTWPMSQLGQLINYQCSDDSVNAKHRCQAPGSLATDLTNYVINKGGAQPSNNEYIRPYQTLDCPKRVDPCGANVKPYGTVEEEGTYPPSCGYCSLGDPNFGSRQHDQNYGLYPDADGNQTGYCVGFSQYSRCRSNADCTFTNFEYWGAHQQETRTDAVVGFDYDNVTIDFPFLFKEGETTPRSKQPEPATVNLPRPLFAPSDFNSADDPVKDQYQVPMKYSEPAVVTKLSVGDECLVKPMQYMLNAIRDEIKTRMNDCSDQEDGNDTHCLGGITDWIGNLANNMQDPVYGPKKIYDGIANLDFGKILGGILDPIGIFSCSDASCKSRAKYGQLLFAQLANNYKELGQRCVGAAMLYPNGYASHFEEIAAKDQSYNRRITLAPFVVNPLYDAIRSLGYQTDQTEGYCENFDKHDECCQGSSFQSSRVRAYFLQGLWHDERRRLMARNANGLDGNGDCGSSDRELNAALYGFTAGTVVADAFKLEAHLTGQFLDSYPKDILGWTNGFAHRLGDIGKDSLTNNEMPWQGENFFFTKLFPLLAGDYKEVDLSPSQITYTDSKGNLKLSWWQMFKIWTGYGYSQDLVNAFESYLSALQLKTDKQAAYDNTKAAEEKACSDKCDDDVGCMLMCDYPATAAAQKELDAVTDQYDQALYAYQEAYKVDMRKNYYNKTGWATMLDEGDKRLQLYPGAVKAADPAEGKNVKPIFIPGHCEPAKGGTDTDSFSVKAIAGITIARGEQKATGLPGMPYQPIPGWDDRNRGSFLDISAFFINGWHDYTGYYNTDENHSSLSDANGYLQSYKDTFSTNGVFSRAYINGDVIKISGEDVKMKGPVGKAGTYRTTCRCEGGKYDGMAKSSIQECNIGLTPAENPYATDVNGNMIYDPNASYVSDPSAFCKPVSKDDGKPTAECQAKTGIPGSPDPDLDDNICTHRPGYVPRGDVCADGRDQCLVTYNLKDNVSVDSYLKDKDTKAAPSATDVTTGLDTYHFLSGCGANGCDLTKGFTLKDDKTMSAFYQPQPPLVAAPDMTKSQSSANAMPIAALNAFTVNNLPQGLLFTGSGESLVNLRFYAWAANNQGPIKKIVIDWGDGTIDRIDNAQMKNQKPICDTDRECEKVPGLACSSDSDCPVGTGACLQTGYCKKQSYKPCHKDMDCNQKDKSDTCEYRIVFGNSADACRQGYLEFGHVYKCENLDDVPDTTCYKDQSVNPNLDNRCAGEPNLSCDYCKSGEACVPGLAPQGGCYNQNLNHCRFTPRVMVFDNWGWCTGDCSSAQDGKDDKHLVRHPNLGCYDGSRTKINSEVMSNPANSKTIAQKTMWSGVEMTECNDLNEVGDNNFISKDDIYFTRRPWVIYNGSIEVAAGRKALEGLYLQGGGDPKQVMSGQYQGQLPLNPLQGLKLDFSKFFKLK